MSGSQTSADADHRAPLQRAALALKELRARLDAAEQERREPIAVVGIGCRFPGGVEDAEGFWRLLEDGVDATGEVPAARWDAAALHHPDPDRPGTIPTRRGGFLGPVDGFDAGFFGIAPREAASIDPQQRLLLEVTWEALEHAGIDPGRLAGSRTGVFVGICMIDYARRLFDRAPETIDAYAATGTLHSVASGRLSYVLGLTGPSLSVDTACSSSLVAVHLACQSLRSGEADAALAAGVNLILSPSLSLTFARAHMLAADGRCKAFDASADGYGRAEGCGVVVLKRLSDARRVGDRVLAVIRGSAVNQDGSSSGLTVPNGPAQQAVVRAALAGAGVAAEAVGYIEAHGTGTSLGDPIEMGALGGVFAASHSAAEPLWVGSTKTNIGHAEGAAGVAGLIKAVLAVGHGRIPPHLHLHTPNPHIDWAGGTLAVPTAVQPWPSNRPCAGVSSFGFSGTNAHVIVGPAPEEEAAVDAAPPRGVAVLALSARTAEAAAALAGRHAARLAELPEAAWADACRTAAQGRRAFGQRIAVAAADAGEAAALLAGAVPVAAGDGRVAFLFTGQGVPSPGAGRELYAAEPVFRAAVDRCAAAFDARLPVPLVEAMFGAGAARHLETGTLAQPAQFALQVGLVELWRSWGIVPAVVLGHSLGEYAAAWTAGVMGLEDAARLVAARGRLMDGVPERGGMLALGCSEARARAAIGDLGLVARAAVAVLNGPQATVVAGGDDALAALAAALRVAGVPVKPLAVTHAFHSPLMEPMLDAFAAEVATAALSRPGLPMLSTLTGRPADAELADPAYWVRQVREPVRYAEAAAALDPALRLEIGPRPVLGLLGRALIPGAVWLSGLRPEVAEGRALAEAAAALWAGGAPVDWAALQGPLRRRIDLPSYPWQRSRCWVEPAPAAVSAQTWISTPARGGGHPLLGRRQPSALAPVSFLGALDANTPGWLADHRLDGRPVLPAAAMLEMALAAAARAFPGEALAVADMVFERALRLDAPALVQTVLTRGEGGSAGFALHACAAGEGEDAAWSRHATGRLEPAPPQPPPADAAAVRAACPEGVAVPGWYAGLAARGIGLGPSFQGVGTLRCGAATAFAEVALPAAVADDDACRVHPVLLDACLQVAGALAPEDGAAWVPAALGRLALFGRPAGRLSVAARRRDGDGLRVDLTVLDTHGRVVALAEDLRLARWAGDGVADILAAHGYVTVWRPLSNAAAEPPPDWLPEPGALAAALAPALAARFAAPEVTAHAGLLATLERIATGYAVRALERLGWRAQAGERVLPDLLADRLGVAARARPLFRRLLGMLAEDGVLRSDGAGFAVVTAPRADDPSRDLAPLAAAHPLASGELALLERCGAALDEVLRGTVDPLDLLFRDDAAERLYSRSPWSTVMTGLVADAVGAAAAALPAGRRLRVLEVGAGTGGTTRAVLPRLPVGRVACYHFTDIAPAFVARAAETFADAAFLVPGRLDIEGDPVAQGFPAGGFDLVIAANALHATADLGRTLAHVRRLLAPGGLLVLLEGTGPLRWGDLTFGLTDGWWRFADRARRPDYPMLAVDGWRAALAGAGFAAVDTVDPAATPAGGGFRQAVILARADRPAVAATEAGDWLVLADRGGVGAALAEGLAGAGRRVTLLPAGTPPDEIGRRLAGPEGRPLAGAVHLWGLDAGAAPGAAADAALAGALHLAQALLRDGRAAPLWLVTRPPADAPAQAPLWGFAQVAALEHPDLACRRVALAEGAPIAALLGELLHPDAEDRIALDAEGVRRCARLTRVERPPVLPLPSGDAPFRILPGGDGIDGLRVEAVARPAPGPGMVEIRVRAAGVNFRDALMALGAYGGDPVPLGIECAGVVTAVGPGVGAPAPGDAVVAVAPGAFGRFVTVPAALTAPQPTGLDPVRAAALPAAYLTAAWALRRLAGLKGGERVLIHAAAGGTGLAALRLAQAAGAEVHATASPGKWPFLRAFGVRHLYNSRTTAFGPEVRRATGGRGVDVVLNALSGAFAQAGLDALAPGGRFVELGRRDILDAAAVAARRPDVAYHVVDLAATAAAAPETLGPLLTAVLAEVADGRLPPLPVQALPMAATAAALRTLQHARHVGKLVLTLNAPALPVRGDRRCLITGGLGGLGLLVAERLADDGARHLVLAGRRPPSAAAEARIAALRARGVEVRVAALDVADRAALAALLADLDCEGSPLGIVVHAAGVLADGTVAQLDWERVSTVLAPKVAGAWALHELTKDRPLDAFVLFSSAAALLGNPGQANHAAANAFLDALAEHRRARGLPALSIGWGPWAGEGAARERDVTGRLGERGLAALTPAEGLAGFAAACAQPAPHLGIVAVDWPRLLARGAATPFLAEMAPVAAAVAAEADARPALVRELADADPAARGALLEARLAQALARVLGLPAHQPVEANRGFFELGMDSLTSIELRNHVQALVERPLPASLAIDHPTIARLAAHLLGLLELPAAAEPPSSPPPPPPADDGLDGLSEADLGALLSEKLSRIEETVPG